MCKNHDSNGNTDNTEPYTRIRLADFAELQETLDRLADSLDKASATAERYKVALVRVDCLCHAADRAFIGDIARAALYPPITSPGA